MTEADKSLPLIPVTVLMPASMWTAITQQAEAAGVSFSAMTREVVNRGLTDPAHAA
ncbi:hypothetical protein H7U32_01100 [Bifidobacterium pullorum subsp. saeculare]|uniref:Uncharacterized protein n=1 Tax=Bifidobacterium pullorum subsp. saeculare TaxID=78257 RepID=A0A939B907_9BIFI|nr:hypothetical protein [Bifidobacterium pullorum]MBM6698944.1 hypothetical protein [Bifidobacterium pullorum subsp. saeculare]